jgi:two-component system, NarL family, sensor kinase
VTGSSSVRALLLAQHDLDLPAVARSFAECFDGDGSLVLVVDDTSKELQVAAAHPPGGAAERALRIPVGYGMAELVALNGHAVKLDDDSPRNDSLRKLLSLSPGESVARMCVPARGLLGAAVAVISVHRHSPRPFSDAEVARAKPLADLLGLRLHAQRLLTAADANRSARDRLIAQAISAQETERRRIAGDLHDGVTQALVSMNFHLSAADVSLARTEGDAASRRAAAVQIQAARRLARLAYDETRAAISGLHSLILDDLGLVAALESLAQTVPQLKIEFRSDPDEHFKDVPDHCAAALYRIAQEAINNAVKHAGAGRAVLSIRRVSDHVVLAVTDDGAGFDAQMVRASMLSAGDSQHFGLSSIAERCALVGATLRIDSVEGRGTAVIVELPVVDGANDSTTGAHRI